jgi:hypothetical protein
VIPQVSAFNTQTQEARVMGFVNHQQRLPASEPNALKEEYPRSR